MSSWHVIDVIMISIDYPLIIHWYSRNPHLEIQDLSIDQLINRIFQRWQKRISSKEWGMSWNFWCFVSLWISTIQTLYKHHWIAMHTLFNMICCLFHNYDCAWRNNQSKKNRPSKAPLGPNMLSNPNPNPKSNIVFPFEFVILIALSSQERVLFWICFN